MVSALDGITVLDLTRDMVGALATMVLCDNGARVVRVETPESEHVRSRPGYAVWDRGKESIVLDLSDAASALQSSGLSTDEASPALAAFDRLVVGADVLVETFSPSSDYQRLLDYERLAAINPRLVHCSITAYGKEGPLKDEPPIDDLVMARVGILASQPGFRPGPVHVIFPLPSVGAALLADQGIVSSLYAREKTGRGRKIDTSLMAGALLYSPKVVAENMEPNPFQSDTAGSAPFYSLYECADGEWIQLGCVHAAFTDSAAEIMGIKGVIADPKFGGGRPSAILAHKELSDVVARVLETRPCAEWAEAFERADVPHARVRTTEEGMDDPQVAFNEMTIELEDPELGPMMQMGVAIKLSETPGHVKGPRAVIGRHTSEVLSGLPDDSHPDVGSPPPETGTLDPPLHGVKVLEITNLIAGPTAGRCLAELGADVIKMEPPGGDISRPIGRTYFYHLNANKRSLSVNARTPEGTKVAQGVAERADILLANLRPGATERIGLGAEVLKRLNPGLIETHVTGYGPAGPYAHRAGIDPLAQALMGLSRAQGGPGNPPVFYAQLAPTDFTAGALGALGTIMALFVRERTGVAQRVDADLLTGGIFISSEVFVRYEGKPPRRLADSGQHGLGALHRLYETANGWIYLAAESREAWRSLRAALAWDGKADDTCVAPTATDDDTALASRLAEAFRRLGSEEWLDRLHRANVPCVPVKGGHSRVFLEDPQAVASRMVVTHEHPVFGRLALSTNFVQLGGTAMTRARRTPMLGEHTTEILKDLGYSQDRVRELYRNDVVKTDEPPAG